VSRAGDLVLMGPPGVGKGTQARLLADRASWVQLATGDLFRTHLSMRTELGVLAEGYMNKGAYVPDEVTIQMVRERLKEIGAERRIMFDGFPRTLPQAEALDRLLEDVGRRIGAVVLIDVPREKLLERLAARATCSRCQAVYSTDSRPPRVAGVCDRCGGAVVSTARVDDSPEVVRKRLEVYDEQTRPVIDFYERRGLVRRVDGVGAVDEITERVLEAAK